MNVQAKLSEFFKSSRRVWKLSRKPDRTEYTQTSKITGLGIVLLGLLGFLIMLIAELILRYT
ncbi:MAG: protein translocase SEC61 complex subunit gamma [Methanomicrobia archaeon]|jgi:protein transport protein SEC61 subunit gamma-like protein|nr:protein translocase SEC61 complex subunit gamma [Methanomicrobia archaeon]